MMMNNSPDSLKDRLNLPEAEPVPWTPSDVAWGLVVFVLWICFFVVVGLLGDSLDLPVDVGLVVVFGEAVLLLPTWYFSVHKYGVRWADLGLRYFHPQAVGLGCGLMLLAFGLNFVYGLILAMFDLQVQPDIALIFEETNFPLALFFGGTVVAPIVEEVFFRGFVFAGLRDNWGWKKAAVASAILFAIAHVLPTSLLPIFFLGLIFAFLYQASGSIWPPILMHMLTNGLALSAAYAVSRGWVPTP